MALGDILYIKTKWAHVDLQLAAESLVPPDLPSMEPTTSLEKPQDEGKWVCDSSVDHRGRLPRRSSTGGWKASLFIIGTPIIVTTTHLCSLCLIYYLFWIRLWLCMHACMQQSSSVKGCVTSGWPPTS